ncbi:uncharacterized protein SETTUDRAFT_124059 [Exserohilum turcica Et28A]|uniref:Uncharacterized protein n=1 Tax=Exserohilum turcicum (strain 28A) TaxID=671987 RepID=R0JX15_EXST2|nr:uncharacterized protein SETTUDRAFT_124059 [Exserohilum turcica Et28A]EOA80802.1 hypothetical protein SETTUDRAFT_124059 [Exserohilum turcica Et28A]
MQNYGQTPGYQQPGSAAGFAGQQGGPTPAPPPPQPGYGVPQGYQSIPPQAQSQWTIATPTQTQVPGAWNQSQQQIMAGYNPGTYGAMPAAQQQQQQYVQQQQQGQPPPSPPKPQGFAAAVQRQEQLQKQQQPQQAWPQQPQQTTGFIPQAQQGGYPIQGNPQQAYQQAAPPPPSAVQGAAYYPPPQGGRPSSTNSITQAVANSNAQPTGSPQVPATASPVRQQSTYIPPALNGQGGQQYTPSNTNSAQRVYASTPPPNAPGWQQVQPTQSAQPVYQSQQPPPLPVRFSQQAGQIQQQQQYYQYGQQAFAQYPPQTPTPPQQTSSPFQAQQHNYQQQPQGQSQVQAQAQNQWQPPPPPAPVPNPQTLPPSYANQQAAQQPQTQTSGQEQAPLNRTNTAVTNLSESNPSQPVSPVSNRPSLSFASGQRPSYERVDSIGSVAFANYQAQRANDKPLPQTQPTPPPPRDDKSTFSALAAGGPSDWEHLGGGDEIDDEELFAAKPKQQENKATQSSSVELPAHVPSPPSTHGFPSPAVHPANLDSNDSGETYMPTPPSSTANLSEQRPPYPAHGGFVVNDAIVAPLRTAPKPADNTQRLRDNHLASESLPGSAQVDSLTAEIKAKDELIDQLRADLQRETDTRNAEIGLFTAERLKLESESEAARNHAANEMSVLQAQIDNMRLTADQANANSDAVAREKERDNTIAELRHQLEVERTKELPKPTAADLIPDLDPWYVSSLEKYIAMLRSEAMEPQLEEKMKIFKAFMKAESAARGIDFFDTPPKVPAKEPVQGSNSDISDARPNLRVQVPQEIVDEDDHDYSPGGRPILMRQPTMPSLENIQPRAPTAPSVQSTTILTPTSSVDDDANKTPIQSLPEGQPQSQYKAYIPPSTKPEEPAPLSHRFSMNFSGTPTGARGPDEIFFGTGQPRTQRYEDDADEPIPRPLSLHPHRPTSMILPSKDDGNKILAAILPRHLEGPTSRQLQELKYKLKNAEIELVGAKKLEQIWEESASLTRWKNDDARRKRQDENEERNDELFNGNEISYAEMKQMEEDFKSKEAALKTKKVEEEYKSYVEAVFDPVYNGLEAEMHSLMDVYVEAEHLLQTSVSGIKSLEGGDPPSTEDCLELLDAIYKQVEKRHEGVVHVVAERDRCYKKTEIQPLYATGKIAQVRDTEKHFESAEKQAALKAKREKARRIGQLVSFAEDVVVNALSTEQKEMDQIVAAIKSLDDGTGDADLLARAHSTLDALKRSSKALLTLFNDLEVELNSAVMDADIAEAQSQNADAKRVQELQAEKKQGEKKLVEEYIRRVRVLESDQTELKELVERKMSKGHGNADQK